MNNAVKKSLRILYVGNLGAMSKCTQRAQAIERLGNDVHKLDTWDYEYGGHPLAWRIRLRTLIGKPVLQLNQEVLRLSEKIRPNLIWFDKAIFIWPETVARLREMGIYTAHQIEDNPFGPRNDPGWGILRQALPEYDIFLVPRKVNISNYLRAGARDVMYLPFGYDPLLQFQPPIDWSDNNRSFDAIYIGFPHDGRANFFDTLWRKYGIKVCIWGDSRWTRTFPRQTLPSDARKVLVQGGRVSYEEYRELLWKARMCFSFVTHTNQDEIGGRSLEITAAGAVLLAEDTPGHRSYFIDGQEALLFRSVDHCAQLIKRYIHDEPARALISGAGNQRALSSGYSYDAVIAPVLDYIRSRLSGTSKGLKSSAEI